MPGQSRLRKKRKPGGFTDAVLATLADADAPQTGLELARQLSKRGVIVSTSHVYRALKTLVRQKVIVQVATSATYLLSPANPSIVLICRVCGGHELTGARGGGDGRCRMEAEKHHFSPDRVLLEIIGRCAACANRQ